MACVKLGYIESAGTRAASAVHSIGPRARGHHVRPLILDVRGPPGWGKARRTCILCG